jgi:hypothetical protein
MKLINGHVSLKTYLNNVQVYKECAIISKHRHMFLEISNIHKYQEFIYLIYF